MGTAASTGGGAPQSTGGAPQSTGGTPQSTGGAQSTGGYVGWGDDWRTRMAVGSTDMEREVKQLERYESPEQVWRKARELERKMSSGELRSTLKKDATSQELAQYRKEMGIPETADGYKINMPAGKQAPKEDDGFLKAFLGDAHAANYTQAQVDSAITAFYDQVDLAAEGVKVEEQKRADATEDQLRKEWGADYRTNKAMIDAAISRAPTELQAGLTNSLKTSAAMAKWMVQMEREINPAATVVPGATGDVGKTIATELADLLKKSQAPKGSAAYKEYWEGGGDARYRELITARDKLQAKKAA